MQLAEQAPATRIMLVEDEAIIAHDLKRRLERLGYEVVGVADNGAEALVMAAQTRPTLVFMDIVIQGPMDGVETAAELLLRQDVPIVFLTAHTDAATIDRAKRVRPYGYLVKPFEEREITTTVEMALYRHQSEAQARLLKSAIASATTGIVVADARSAVPVITLCNPAFERITGYSAAEVVGGPIGFLQGPDTDPADVASLMHALASRLDLRQTTTCHRKDGKPFTDETTLSTVRNAVGEVTHFLFFHSDVTERRKTQDALLQSQKMEGVGQLAGGVAHDFNNILAVILSYAAFVQEELPEGHALRGDMAEIVAAARRAADLTRQLLTFARQQPSARRPVDLNASFEDLMTMVRRAVGEHIAVEVTPSARPAIVRMDPVQIDQVLLNLAVNARDAMARGGRLRFSLSHPAESAGPLAAGRYVRLVVADTGSGMDAATMARIFDPFFTTKGLGKGTGLGLATCRTIVEEAGGTIAVDSAPGKGTIFTIDLPVCDEPLEPEEEDRPSVTLRLAKERVLLVEDDAALRRATARILASAGYRVTEAEDGAEAVRVLDQHGAELDLVITDVVMPGRGGHEVAEHAKLRAPKAGVLMISGYLDGQDASGSPDARHLLWKPFTPSSLLAAAHAALNRGSSRPPSAVSTAPQRGVVLLVDDDPVLRAAIERVLVRGGYDVEIADSVATAREALAPDRDYAAIVCDLALSDGSGADLLGWLRSTRPALARRTLVLTGGAMDDAGRRLEADGVTEVLRKPVDVNVLLERVGAVSRRQGAP